MSVILKGVHCGELQEVEYQNSTIEEVITYELTCEKCGLLIRDVEVVKI